MNISMVQDAQAIRAEQRPSQGNVQAVVSTDSNQYPRHQDQRFRPDIDAQVKIASLACPYSVSISVLSLLVPISVFGYMHIFIIAVMYTTFELSNSAVWGLELFCLGNDKSLYHDHPHVRLMAIWHPERLLKLKHSHKMCVHVPACSDSVSPTSMIPNASIKTCQHIFRYRNGNFTPHVIVSPPRKTWHVM